MLTLEIIISKYANLNEYNSSSDELSDSSSDDYNDEESEEHYSEDEDDEEYFAKINIIQKFENNSKFLSTLCITDSSAFKPKKKADGSIYIRFANLNGFTFVSLENKTFIMESGHCNTGTMNNTFNLTEEENVQFQTELNKFFVS